MDFGFSALHDAIGAAETALDSATKVAEKMRYLIEI